MVVEVAAKEDGDVGNGGDDENDDDEIVSVTDSLNYLDECQQLRS